MNIITCHSGNDNNFVQFYEHNNILVSFMLYDLRVDYEFNFHYKMYIMIQEILLIFQIHTLYGVMQKTHTYYFMMWTVNLILLHIVVTHV